MDDPQDPMASMFTAAVGQHELYTSWIDAGFTEEQAFDLLKVVIAKMVEGAHEC